MKRIYYYYIALSGFFGLFILLMLWNTLLVPSTHFPVALVLLAVITPLLIPLRGFLNGNLKSCTWMSYLSLFYFTYGIAEAYTTPAELYYALLEVFFSLLLCAGSGFYVYTAEQVK
ncbi:MAG: DUF2069 domain-containing protein [Methylococcaceae bacterium]|nr:DUF2069 domain-containing protein [Methylococcaceae bacterium]